MQVEADDLDARQAAREVVDRERLIVGDAELVVAPAGADLVVRAGGDVRVDPERDRRRELARRRDLAQHDQLRHRFDVELRDPRIERQDHLVAALADAGEHDAPGRHAGGERALELARRDHVGAGALLGEGPDHREVGVRLDRVAQHDPLPGEGREETPHLAPHAGRRIDVGGRADRRGDRRERHRLGVQLAVPVGEGAAHPASSSSLSPGSGSRREPFLPQAASAASATRTAIRRRRDGARGINRRRSRHGCRAPRIRCSNPG